MSSMVIASWVRSASLVNDFPLIWEHILVMRVIQSIGGSVGLSKICPSKVLDKCEGGRGGREVVCWGGGRP